MGEEGQEMFLILSISIRKTTFGMAGNYVRRLFGGLEGRKCSASSNCLHRSEQSSAIL
jgi:hypothetical protein